MKTRRTIEILAILAMLAMGRSTHGAITAVSNGSFGGSAPGATVSQSITVGAGADMLIVMTASELGGTVTQDMIVTYGGIAMNLATGTKATTGIWYLDLSTPGIAGTTVIVDMSGYSVRNGFAAGWVSIDGNLGAGDSIALHSTGTSAAASHTVDLTTTEETFNVVNFNGNNTGTVTVNSPNPTVIYTDTNIGSACSAAAYEAGVAAGPNTYQWTLGNPGTADVNYRRIDAAAFAVVGPDTTAPVFQPASSTPTNGATGVAIDVNLVADFDEAIFLSGSGTITISNAVSAFETFTLPTNRVTVSGNELTIDPNSDFAYSTAYSVYISSNAVTNAVGLYFPGITNNTTWAFTTMAPDTTAPSITDLSPTNGATGVLVDASLEATFDEAIYTNTTGSIVITNTSDNELTATIAIGDTSQITVSGMTLTIDPTNPLDRSTSYAILIDTNALKDVVGNFFTNATDWAFETTSVGDGSWNGISGNWSDTTNPGGVWLNGIPADGSAYTANFTGVDISAAKTITVDTPRTIGTIIFTDDTTSSHDLTIDASGGSALTLAGSRTINVTQADRTLTISGEVAGSSGILKSGAGTASLTAANSLSGAVTVNGGTLKLTAANNSIGNITINANSTLQLDGGTISDAGTLDMPDGQNYATLILTNGASLAASVSAGTAIGYKASYQTMTVHGGTGTSVFNGKGGSFSVGYDTWEDDPAYNELEIGAGGVVTNLSYMYVGGLAGRNQASATWNTLQVTDGGELHLSSYMRVACITAVAGNGQFARNNSVLIGNGGVVRTGGQFAIACYMHSLGNGATHSGNTLTITGGGRLFSAGASYVGGVVTAPSTPSGLTGKWINNTATVSGQLNGTNATWDCGNNALFVGYRHPVATYSTVTGNKLQVDTYGVVTNVSALTLGATNAVTLGAGGKIYASSATLAGTLNAGIDDSEPAGACGLLTVSGVLDVTGADLNIDAIGTPKGQAYVIASYGSMSGTFAATNGLMPDYEIDMNYRSLNQIAIVGPPAGTVLIIR